MNYDVEMIKVSDLEEALHAPDAGVAQAFGALRDHFFSTRDVSERLKGKIYTGGVLAVLLYEIGRASCRERV